MDNLEAEIRKAITRKVVEDFKDPLGPLRAMTEAAYAAPGKRFTHTLSLSLFLSLPLSSFYSALSFFLPYTCIPPSLSTPVLTLSLTLFG